MKNKLLTTITCLAIALNANAKGGVYMTAADFKNNKLSYDVECKVRLNNSIAILPYITVIDHGRKVKLKKSDIYGYVDCDNTSVRFYKNEEYRIADAGNITIYIQIERVSQSKGYKVKKNFYFSVSPESAVLPLNLESLKQAYHSNDKFLDLVDQFFGNGDVTAYDNIHNTYKVNYVYSKAIKQ